MIITALIFIVFTLALLLFYKFKTKTENFTISEIKEETKKSIIVRIIGNTLPEINHPEQNLNNLKYILENEQEFPNVKKIWVLNRIVNSELEDKYKKLLTQNGKRFETISFDKKYFNKLQKNTNSEVKKKNKTDYKYFKEIAENMNKILYISNINGARNYALNRFRTQCDYTMVLDGNIFLTEEKFNEISNVMNNGENDYILIPIKRIGNYKEINEENLNKLNDGEPQIIFSKDSKLTFNENIPYGFSNKVELLNIIGSNGHWKNYKDNEYLNIKSRNANGKKYSHDTCAYFIRLPSLFDGESHKNITQTDRSKAMLKLINLNTN